MPKLCGPNTTIRRPGRRKYAVYVVHEGAHADVLKQVALVKRWLVARGVPEHSIAVQAAAAELADATLESSSIGMEEHEQPNIGSELGR